MFYQPITVLFLGAKKMATYVEAIMKHDLNNQDSTMVVELD